MKYDMCSTMIFDVIEYFAEYSLIEIISDMTEICLISKNNCFTMFFSKKICKNLKISLDAGIPAGQEFSTSTGPGRPVTITGFI